MPINAGGGGLSSKLSVVDSEIMKFNNNKNFEKFQENFLKKKATSHMEISQVDS